MAKLRLLKEPSGRGNLSRHADCGLKKLVKILTARFRWPRQKATASQLATTMIDQAMVLELEQVVDSISGHGKHLSLIATAIRAIWPARQTQGAEDAGLLKSTNTI